VKIKRNLVVFLELLVMIHDLNPVKVDSSDVEFAHVTNVVGFLTASTSALGL
jgi:hypothetical protein